MSCVSDLSQSSEYLSFRSSIPLRKIVVDSDGVKTWRIFDSGPKSVNCPLICLPPVSGTADIFYKQVMGLASRGIRVIAAEPPPYWNMKEWCDGFKRLIDYLELDKVHVFGASLGGFMAQKFAELTRNCSRVASLILCNTFTDTSVFEYNDSSALFWLLPSLVLKRMLMGNFTTEKVDRRMAESIDFMVERLESLTQSELASRLTLNCSPSYVQPQQLNNIPITIMDVWDESALSSQVREDIYKSYPHAKRAHLKNGGNFPYLSRSDEVNLHLLIHLRQFDNTELTASYLNLHKMPASSNENSDEGSVSYFNRENFVKISN
ncbi:maspardin-like [Galleria mellonella]|uniref:Maspardin n=1 Tax=Galleria mellonella TaxID=7137 RepID=A0A6J3C433_GALME|nr:maspardin-like [Galleria mellonella]XP_031765720.1 maspardin-like [Galleria mellonella]XP_052755839.1 maspardin-like [Galleria mellonella]